jgi:transcriptional regulator NrdR family protein
MKQQEHKSELLPASTKSEDVHDRMCGMLVLQGLRSSETQIAISRFNRLFQYFRDCNVLDRKCGVGAVTPSLHTKPSKFCSFDSSGCAED